MITAKPCIVWVDHDSETENHVRVLGEVVYEDDYQKLQSKLDLAFVLLPDEQLPPMKGIDQTVSYIQSKLPKGRVDLILVDLCLYPGNRSNEEGFRTGLDVARRLAESAGASVGLFTSVPINLLQRARISVEPFVSVFLDDWRKLLPRGGATITGVDWYQLLTKAAVGRTGVPSPIPDMSSLVPRVVWSDQKSEPRQPGLRKAAPMLVHKLFCEMPGVREQIELEVLGGGFSGSHVLRASQAGVEKSWIIKIDEDPERLREELNGYREVEARVSSDRYCPVFSQASREPVWIWPDWWAAIALTEEQRGKPLLHCVGNLSSDDLCSVYERVWDEALRHLYAGLRSGEICVSDLVGSAHIKRATNALASLLRYSSHASTVVPGDALLAATKASEWLSSAASISLPLLSESIPAPFADQIHGDLNCRNILYRSDERALRLIDFPNVREGCAAVDFTKAEAELVLILMDWGTGYDCDFGRFRNWNELVRGLGEFPMRPSSTPMSDPEVIKILSAAQTLRGKYYSICEGLGLQDEVLGRAYMLCLLGQLIPYVSYDDITPAKRILALLWIGQILESL